MNYPLTSDGKDKLINELTEQVKEKDEEILHLTALINMPENQTYKEAVFLLDRCDKKNQRIRTLEQQIKQLQEEIKVYENCYLAKNNEQLRDIIKKLNSERDELKSKIEKINFRNNVLWMNEELQEMLGEKNEKC